MLKITSTGRNAKPDADATLNEALETLASLIDAHATITLISAKRIALTAEGCSGEAKDRTTITVADGDRLAPPLIALARNALFFLRRVHNSYGLQMVERNQPYTERAGLLFGPRPDRETGFYVCGRKGTAALLFTLGIQGRDAFARLDELTQRDLKAFTEEALAGNPIEVAKGYGILD